ncbi:MAG: DAK2 domain-containing protein [Pseudomonadota bacterium]
MTPRAYFERLMDVFSAEEQRLNQLDADIGDGDHGTTMVRGLKAAVAAEDGRQAKAFMRASGGAAGTLFGLVLHELEQHLDGQHLQLERAIGRIKTLGKVKAGDKTMIDALEPAEQVLTGGGSFQAAFAAAEEGRDATRDMVARSGRARYVENAGVGHVDPGATSVCLLLQALADAGEQP